MSKKRKPETYQEVRDYLVRLDESTGDIRRPNRALYMFENIDNKLGYWKIRSEQLLKHERFFDTVSHMFSPNELPNLLGTPADIVRHFFPWGPEIKLPDNGEKLIDAIQALRDEANANGSKLLAASTDRDRFKRAIDTIMERLGVEEQREIVGAIDKLLVRADPGNADVVAHLSKLYRDDYNLDDDAIVHTDTLRAYINNLRKSNNPRSITRRKLDKTQAVEDKTE